MNASKLLAQSAVGLAVIAAFLPSVLADNAPRELTIATWNLEWFFDANPSDNRSKIAKEQAPPNNEVWIWKRDAIAASISKMAPTILAVQEVENRDVMLDLIKVLKEQHQKTYRVAFIDGFDLGTEQDVAILYQSGLVEYSRREQSKEMFDSRDYYNLSKHIIGKFEWQTSDGKTESLVMLNVHFRATAEAASFRRRQANLAHKWVADYVKAGENVVVLGDMNLESRYGTELEEDDGIDFLLGTTTADTTDDLKDLHEFASPEKRRTHLVLEREFDRILVSPSMIEDDPAKIDIVFKSIAAQPQYTIVGDGPDLDHWDTRYTKEVNERDLSDHYPLLATFEFK